LAVSAATHGAEPICSSVGSPVAAKARPENVDDTVQVMTAPAIRAVKARRIEVKSLSA
jgi:hypothetical protein